MCRRLNYASFAKTRTLKNQEESDEKLQKKKEKKKGSKLQEK